MWIKPSEELPKNNEHVLCLWCESPIVAEYNGSNEWLFWHDEKFIKLFDDEISHWQSIEKLPVFE